MTIVTAKDVRREKRNLQKRELADIESKLHPCPTIDGIEILHEHRGRKIIFTAWKGDNPANNKLLEYSRDEVLYCVEFYGWNNEAINWLARID